MTSEAIIITSEAIMMAHTSAVHSQKSVLSEGLG